MKWMKNVFLILLLIFVLDCPVLAVEQEDISGVNVYMMQAGAEAIKENPDRENFWIFLEVLDREKKPILGENWEVTVEVKTPGGTFPCKLNKREEIRGYISEEQIEVTLVDDFEGYTIGTKINGEQGIIYDNKENEKSFSDCVVQWPQLATKPWKETVYTSEKLEKLNRDIVFDWGEYEDLSRLFQVEIKKIPKNLEVRQVENKQIFQLKVNGSVKESIKIELKDANGNSQEIPYTIDIEYQNVLIIGSLLLAVLVFLCVAGLMKKKKSIGSEKTSWEEEQEYDFVKTKKTLEKAWDEMGESKRELNRQASALNEELKKNEEIIEKLNIKEKYLQYTKEEEEFEEEKKCKEAIRKISSYFENMKKYQEEWRDTEKRNEFRLVARQLSEKRKEVDQRIKEYEKIQRELKQELEKYNERKRMLEMPLQMAVSVTLSCKDQKYKINKSFLDSGFVLDEVTPLNLKTYRTESNKTVQDLIGEETGIRIYAENKKIVLDTLGENLYKSNQQIHHLEMNTGNLETLIYKKQKERESITIEIVVK